MRGCIEAAAQDMSGTPEEIRLRIGSSVCLRFCGEERYCCEPLTKQQMLWIVGNASEGSYHRAARFLKMGYIPLRYGSRMGVCGMGADGTIASFEDVSSACIRIAHAAIGCGDGLDEELYGAGFRNTIIIAPPGLGKTTLLRELIRKLSYNGLYVGAADERGEIAGLYGDKPSFDLGPRTDILSGISKSQGAMMLLRSMTPNVLAMDEITAHKDSEVILEAAGCGAGLLTTIHGESPSVLQKHGFQVIYESGIFHYGILIGLRDGKRVYKAVKLYGENMGSFCNHGGGRLTGMFSADENEGTNPSA